MKRIVVISDLHSGHRLGLTPQSAEKDAGEDEYKQYVYRRAIWDFYTRTLDGLKPIDILVANGDLIEGKGTKNGAKELIATQRTQQIRWATEAVEYAGAKEHYFTFGTGYHVGPEDDWEIEVAQEFGGAIKNVQYLTVNGLTLAFRHHVGGSQSVPGRFTPLNSYRFWQLLWSFDGEFPRPDVSVASHTHQYLCVRDRFGMAINTPGLQGYGSDYGARRMNAVIDVGLISFDVEDKTQWTHKFHRLVHTGVLASVATKAGESKSILTRLLKR